MIRIAERELSAARRRVSPLVVVGLGHNTLWERNRRNYDMWSARFDAESRKLVATLRRLGARQIVWVTLREPRPAIVPPGSGPELHRYAWYFPYVNARLHRLDDERDDLSLADWTTAVQPASHHVRHDALQHERRAPDGPHDQARDQRRGTAPGARRPRLKNRQAASRTGGACCARAIASDRNAFAAGGWRRRPRHTSATGHVNGCGPIGRQPPSAAPRGMTAIPCPWTQRADRPISVQMKALRGFTVPSSVARSDDAARFSR